MGIIAKSLGLEAAPPTASERLARAIPSRSDTSRVTTASALSLPAVFRSIQITAGMAGSLTLDAYRDREKLERPPVVVRTPDPWRSLSSWVERAVIDLAVDGNAFLLKSLSPIDGTTVVGAQVLNPFGVVVDRDTEGRKVYRYSTVDGIKTYTDQQIEHVWGLEVPGLTRGLGPITACRMSILGALDARDFGAAWHSTNAVPPGVLSTDQHIDATAAKQYKELWHDGTPGEVKVTGKGLTFTPIMLRPKDAQWLESQAFGVLDIARLFGVPAAYLMAGIEGSSVTYQNLEMVDAQFLRTTLFPVYLRKLEAAMTNLLPRGQHAKFDTSELLRPDAKTRMEMHKLAIDMGLYGPEYAAVIERIPATAVPAPAPRKEAAA